MGKALCIYGAGGFGREVLCCHLDAELDACRPAPEVVFMVDDDFHSEAEIMGRRVIRRSEFDPSTYRVVVAVGDCTRRQAMVDSLPAETEFASVFHPSAVISDWVQIGEGSVVTAGVILTCAITIGRHAHLNLHSTVGHDCVIGDYFTAAPGAKISGGCTIGDRVNVGTNAALREKVTVCDDVTIGLGAGVVADICAPGVYVGVPAKRLA